MQAILKRSIVWEGTPAHDRQSLSTPTGPCFIEPGLFSTLSTERLFMICEASALSLTVRKLLCNKFLALADPGFEFILFALMGPLRAVNWEDMLVFSFEGAPKIEFSDPILISGILRRFVPPNSYIFFRSDSSCTAKACSIELNSTKHVITVA